MLSSRLRSCRRAFSIAIAAVRGEQHDQPLVGVGERRRALLVRQVQRADDAAARDDRHAEERAHVGCAAGHQPRKALVRVDVGVRYGRGRLEHRAEHPVRARAAGPIAAISSSLMPGRDEAREAALAVGHAERGVARAAELARGMHEPLQHRLDLALGRDREHDVGERAERRRVAIAGHGGPTLRAAPSATLARRWHHGLRVGISTETREHAVGPVRDGLLELIAEQRPNDAAALSEFASAYLRRLSADAAETMSAEELFAEVGGAFDFAATRGEHPIIVARVQPDGRRARLRARRIGARDQHGRPAVPGRLGPRRAARAGARDPARAAPDRRARARRRGAGSSACCTRARRTRASR
jgi:hypothetical protein